MPRILLGSESTRENERLSERLSKNNIYYDTINNSHIIIDQIYTYNSFLTFHCTHQTYFLFVKV